jgi:ATP-dependent RNA helicase SUPV3L1/SUV3
MVGLMERADAGSAGRSRITAVLGPTNTGKTHLAMERLLGHPSGMIGFPLRLLARENYDRAVRLKGRGAVALMTGEEKIVPPQARWFLCTVESMPLSRPVDFLAIDEIQMCADPDRGHLFTDRLLHARGTEETMFLGAETIRPLLRRLVPGAEVVSRPRFSTLAFAGHAKLSRLPPRSAIVAFSAADVYAIAELIRRERGGAAIVLGALSPRTRNAQVDLYQEGEVDYLVATDAIGMGLNMAIDHVAFAATRKFDGRGPRTLTPAELAQIAGRAGRYTRDGTFGTTADLGPLEPETVERIENHAFETLQTLFWRDSRLSFTSIEALKASLGRPPRRSELVRTRRADDEAALEALERDPEIVRRARGHEAVRLLWEVCRIPDFGNVASDGHARLLARIFRFLAGGEGGAGRLPTDWVARQVERINRTDGDIEALMQRIANIRIWTYVAHRDDWLTDAGGWQERTRAIEDTLSDALHQRLVQRFVDRRTASIYGRIRERQPLAAAIAADGDVLVEGHFVGTLDGFRFFADAGAGRDGGLPGGAGRAVTAAALRALKGEIGGRLRRLEAADDRAFSMDETGTLHWHGAAIARLGAGAEPARPRVEPLPSELLAPDQRLRLRRRLERWVCARLARDLAPLAAAGDLAVSGAARGLLFQVGEGLGYVPRHRAEAQIAHLTEPDRRALAAAGLRIGRLAVYFPALLEPKPMAQRAMMWGLFHRRAAMPPLSGMMSLPIADADDVAALEAIGYCRLGPRAVRADVAERVAARARRLSRRKTSSPAREFTSLIGCTADELPAVLAALGYAAEPEAEGLRLRPRRPRPAKPRRRPRRARREPAAAAPGAARASA